MATLLYSSLIMLFTCLYAIISPLIWLLYPSSYLHRVQRYADHAFKRMAHVGEPCIWRANEWIYTVVYSALGSKTDNHSHFCV